jgi:hypothetical protein
MGCDLAEEAQSVGFVAPFLMRTGELQRAPRLLEDGHCFSMRQAGCRLCANLLEIACRLLPHPPSQGMVRQQFGLSCHHLHYLG